MHKGRVSKGMCPTRGARVQSRGLPPPVAFASCMRQELGRCGLLELQEEWASIARKGYCSMNPTLGRWLLEGSGAEVGPPTVQHALGLSDVLPLLAPDHKGLLQQAHDAGCDAQMTRWVYVALVDRVRALQELESAQRGDDEECRGDFAPGGSSSPRAGALRLATEGTGTSSSQSSGSGDMTIIIPMS